VECWSIGMGSHHSITPPLQNREGPNESHHARFACLKVMVSLRDHFPINLKSHMVVFSAFWLRSSA
jgi:hypothetical protein